MRFITFGYLLFFTLVFIIYWQLKKKHHKLLLIALSSSLFYASWSVSFFIHFAFLILLNYFFSLRIRSNTNHKKIYFTTIVLIDIFNLIFFKYFYLLFQFLYDLSKLEFFQRQVLNSFLFEHFYQESIVLPLAISFYTFQLLAYIIDCYKEKIQRRDSLLEFYVFILFFPQLVAGPIMRHSDFFFQLDSELCLTHERVIKGFYLIFIGLIKKVFIADNITNTIQPVFLNPLEYNGMTNFLSAVGYAVRVYADFSGYTDIARGSAYLLGFHIPENFDGPFFSTTISEFWRRWHVTLSSWLRDYIYIPLGGNRISKFRTNINLIITFTLGGLWHGANYTYIIWGFFYGVLLVIEKPFVRIFKEMIQKHSFLRFIGILYTFLFFSIGFCFFNAPNLENSYYMLKQIFLGGSGSSFHKDQLIQILGFLVMVFGFNYLQYYKNKLVINIKRDYFILFILGLFVIGLLGNYAPQTQGFIYFQF